MPRTRRRSRSRKRPSARTRRRRRRSVLAVAGVAAVAFVYFGGLERVQELLPEQVEAGPDGDAGVDAELARERLAGLSVAEWDSMRGYSRDRFPHWRTVDGCDVRQTVLARDGEDVDTGDDSCEVVDGSWRSAYDGQTVTDPGDVDIDHTVPLANAWRTGAGDWDEDRRAGFANDLDSPQLLAVSATSNRAKGDQDPSQWRPPEDGYWCRYAADWVAVKDAWELSVTGDERDALAVMLDTCD